MQPSSSLVVQALLAALVVTEVAAAPITQREVGYNESPIVEKRKNPLYETGVGGKPAPKPSIVNVGKIKPVAPISTTPKKPITPVTKGKREVGHNELPIVEKRKNPMYETGVGGKPAPKPSIVNVGKVKPVAPISTTPKKPITPVTKGKGKREEHA
ncbi:hypothetical protein RB597_005397 [Gaeumannomyces tritici]